MFHRVDLGLPAGVSVGIGREIGVDLRVRIPRKFKSHPPRRVNSCKKRRDGPPFASLAA